MEGIVKCILPDFEHYETLEFVTGLLIGLPIAVLAQDIDAFSYFQTQTTYILPLA